MYRKKSNDMKKLIYPLIAASLFATGCQNQNNATKKVVTDQNINTKTKGGIDINKMPVSTKSPTVNITEPKSFRMENGLTVMIVENHKLPRVTASLSIDRQPVLEGNIAGVSDILASQLGEGTKTMSKDAFNKRIDYLGASLNFTQSGAFANSLSKYFPEVFGMMADAVKNPRFDQKEVEKAKDREIESLKVDEKSADAIARRTGNAVIYGKNTSRGEFPTEQSIRRVSVRDVENYFHKYYAPDQAYLVISGDIKYDEAKKLAEQHFSGWKKSGTVYPALEPANNVARTEINIVDVPSAVQSVISVGNLTELKMSDPDYFASMVANYILGGGGESRLFMNLREKNGFTYGAYSGLSVSKYSPSFRANASVRNEVTDKAVVEFMNELNGIGTVSEKELADAKAKLKGDFIRSLERPETLARFAVNQRIYNLPTNFYQNYLKSIDAVTVNDVKKAVQRNILPEQSRIFIAGKASEIGEPLEKLGYDVKYYDTNANPVAKPLAKKVDANVTAETVGKKYIDAIGGEANVKKIKSVSTEASAKLQGMELTMLSTMAEGGKTRTEVKMMGQTMQKMVFDGKAGYMEAQGQKMPMPADAAAELANRALFPELDFKGAQLSGIENFNGEDCYVVKSGTTTYYYSVKTGLKTGEVRTIAGQTIPTMFADYRDVSGVKMPFKITQTIGGMNLEMTVTSQQVNVAKDSDFQ